MASRTFTTCPECNGKGTVLLKDGQLLILAILRRRKRPMTAQDILVAGEIGDVGVTAMNNRLERLRDLDFVVRERRGRAWAYSMAPKKKE